MKAGKLKYIILFCVILVLTIGLIITYFIIAASDKKHSKITVQSYDKEVTLYIERDDNIKKVDKENINGFDEVIVSFGDREAFLQKLAANEGYYKTFEYINGSHIKTRVLMLCENYYFAVTMSDTDDTAQIKSLFASVSIADVYPAFNDSLSIEFGLNDGVPYGGSLTVTVDEFNALGNYSMKENAFTCYEDLVDYYSHTNPSGYRLNPTLQKIELKLYSRSILGNGTHYYDGYPITIEFEADKIILSLDLSIIY